MKLKYASVQKLKRYDDFSLQARPVRRTIVRSIPN